MTTASAELMTRAQAGDIDAFAELYAIYRPVVLSVARKRLPEQAEDIVQDVFVKALGNLGRYRDQGRDVGAWLTTLTVNLCHTWAGCADTRLTRTYAYVPERSFGPDPAEQIVDGLVHREVLAAMDTLTDDQRLAVTLFYLHDLSVRDVMRAMGCSKSATAGLLFRARKTLARVLTAVADA